MQDYRCLFRLKKIFGPILSKIYKPEYVDTNNIPEKGPIIICANHIWGPDAVIVVLSTQRGISFLAEKEIVDNFFVGWLAKRLNCIRVDKQASDNHLAYAQAIEVLNQGGAIYINPEGNSNHNDYQLKPFKLGAVRMAKETGALLVPCAITGNYKPFHGLRASYGKPIDIKDLDLQQANELLYKTIKELMEKNKFE